ncbi:MAG: 2-isopropylmalate synthase [Candidatus Peribacteraceae bacterium]|nr:2-isopropylmalate synthase [Candidatus Peribacteraceae bacterium]MDD5074503.1 2-isopropylmalate synthase [Candidatus Peribacteraceae bacterium]
MENHSQDRPVKIFDTTLRDGEQSPGCSLALPQKIEIADALERLDVDVIEAGFPIASPDDFAAVSAIAGKVKKSVVCGLARCRDEDIDRAWEAVKDAKHPRIHTFLATSPIHRKHKLHMTKQQVIDQVIACVRRASGYCPDIEFSPEDATRTEPKFLRDVVEAAIDAGATTVNIPDTVGYAVPEQMGAAITDLRRHVPNIRQAVISVHCHNDLGMAVANSLAAVKAGAGQVECTINGIGERAGNCSLEEVVMAMRVRRNVYHTQTNIRSKLLVPTSELVESMTFPIQRNKAVVGRNAFAHEAGIHQDGMLKHPRTYEIMQPKDVGRKKSEMVLGKHSGMRAVTDRFSQSGLPWSREHASLFRTKFKELADRKVANDKYVTDAELLQEVYYPVVESIVGKPFVASVVPDKRKKGQPLTVQIRTRDGRTIVGKASNLKEGVIDAFVQGMKGTIPGLNIPAKGLLLTNPAEGSGGKARVTATMHNKHTVSRTVEGTDSDEVIKEAHIAAFNTLYAIEEYQKLIRNSANGKKKVQ